MVSPSAKPLSLIWSTSNESATICEKVPTFDSA